VGGQGLDFAGVAAPDGSVLDGQQVFRFRACISAV
jgi:hypothetical protein